jgi:hypothetical protein
MQYPRALIYTDKFVSGWVVSSTAETNFNKVATSTDGITWTVRTVTGTNSHVNTFAYNGSNTIVASFVSGTNVATSTDGITWTARTLALATASSTKVAYGNSVFVGAQVMQTGATTYNSYISTSTDGITWTYRSTAIVNASEVNNIAYLNNKFWLWGSGGYFSSSSIFTSTDGITWSQDTSLTKVLQNPLAMAYDSTNSLMYAFGSLGPSIMTAYAGTYDGPTAMAISNDDGVTWQLQTIGVDYKSTDTTAVQSVNAISAPQIRSSGMPALSIANNKIFTPGFINIGSVDNNRRQMRWLATFNGPYTYQTDTQFALPVSLGANTTTGYGMADKGQKSAITAPFTSTRGSKYYIKT